MSTNQTTQKEIEEARKKFSEMYSNVKLGGKEAKKLTDTVEVNIFRDDNTVIHFKKPNLEYSIKEKVSFLTGSSEVKHIKDLLPNIIKQLGPKQFSFMKDFAETLKNAQPKTDKPEEAPELVDFEEISKKD